MRFLLVMMLLLGAGLMFAHQYIRTATLTNERVEYRYLPLPLDEWFKEQQFSAAAVMSDMVEGTQGYCSNGTSATLPPVPTTTPTPTPTSEREDWWKTTTPANEFA